MPKLLNLRATLGLSVIVAALLLVLALLVLPTPAAGADPPDTREQVTLTGSGPVDIALGNQARLAVRLRNAAGQPVPGARILFTSPAAFAGAVGEMEIGEAVTDANGTASLDYAFRIEGQNLIIARFLGDGTYQPAEARTTVMVVMPATGQVQLAQRTAGVELPVLGAWTIIAVIGTVWAVYFGALLLVAGIPEGLERQPQLTKGGET
ncbi:MAG: Ig-like domain-containing protein [Chloroflexi bacterium]|nr:Ig-like domain-containing protein [Chloroflexota bacterium]